MKKALFALLAVALCWFAPVSTAEASPYESWTAIADEMTVLLDKSYEVYLTKDIEESKVVVNKAYFGFYEKHGFERATLSYISGKRASEVEYQFAAVKKLMTNNASNKEVRTSLDGLIKMLKEDAGALDGNEQSGWGVFLASLLIIVREGVEAILVVAAIAAYLTRSGNTALTKVVYWSALIAVFASALLAVALQKLFSISGANQELLEGVTMLFAVVVLFFVSNWMVSKAESEAWKNYIESKVSTAVTTGSTIALGAAAFLAVFREGAETILFYQALLADSKDFMSMVWYGFGVGCLILVAVFSVIRFGTMRLPLRPFFLGTSILMYIMSISFAGGGVKELQEADIISVTPVSFIGTVDILGIYPTVETLLPQAVLVILAVAAFYYYTRKKNTVAVA